MKKRSTLNVCLAMGLVLAVSLVFSTSADAAKSDQKKIVNKCYKKYEKGEEKCAKVATKNSKKLEKGDIAGFKALMKKARKCINEHKDTLKDCIVSGFDAKKIPVDDLKSEFNSFEKKMGKNSKYYLEC